MYPSKIDIAVLLLFFTRPEQTSLVFEEIKKARPSKLFLYQDGPRKGREDDLEGIMKCRKIVENIDWDCKVYKMYQEKNYGCDPSEYISQKWMFSIVDKGIILEDDDVPSQSFFPFCKELLDKYENDIRISMISGMCHMDKVDIEDDYFFSKEGPIWGWATWRRTIELWDTNYQFLKNKYICDLLLSNGDMSKYELAYCKRHLLSGREHYESLLKTSRILNNQLSIIPRANLISNIGLTIDAVHCNVKLDEISPKERKLFNKKVYDYKFPLKHPSYVIENKELSKEIRNTMKRNLPENLFYFKKKLRNLFRKLI